jgi:hypothetical protein
VWNCAEIFEFKNRRRRRKYSWQGQVNFKYQRNDKNKKYIKCNWGLNEILLKLNFIFKVDFSLPLLFVCSKTKNKMIWTAQNWICSFYSQN